MQFCEQFRGKDNGGQSLYILNYDCLIFLDSDFFFPYLKKAGAVVEVKI